MDILLVNNNENDVSSWFYIFGQKKEGVKPSFKLIKKFYSLYLNPALNIEPWSWYKKSISSYLEYNLTFSFVKFWASKKTDALSLNSYEALKSNWPLS